jgi:hypothetical protein
MQNKSNKRRGIIKLNALLPTEPEPQRVNFDSELAYRTAMADYATSVLMAHYERLLKEMPAFLADKPSAKDAKIARAMKKMAETGVDFLVADRRVQDSDGKKFNLAYAVAQGLWAKHRRARDAFYRLTSQPTMNQRQLTWYDAFYVLNDA